MKISGFLDNQMFLQDAWSCLIIRQQNNNENTLNIIQTYLQSFAFFSARASH